jgi:hypothetical protein
MANIESAGESGPSSSTVIEILSELENSSDIEVINGPGPVLRDRINKHKVEASKIRLTAKPVSSSGLPARTNDYIKRKKDAHNTATDPKSNAPITFRCELFLQKDTGKKVGTRVPMQSRGFQQSEVNILLSFNFVDCTKCVTVIDNGFLQICCDV